MTDFLSTLVDRALDRAPVLERRPLSVFEPTPVRAPFEDRGSEYARPPDEEGMFLNAGSLAGRRTIESSWNATKIDPETIAPVPPAAEREGAQGGSFRNPSSPEALLEREKTHTDRKHTDALSPEARDRSIARAETADQLSPPPSAMPSASPLQLLVSETIVEREVEPPRSDGPAFVVGPIVARAVKSISPVWPVVARATEPDHNGHERPGAAARQRDESVMPRKLPLSVAEEQIRPMARPPNLPARRAQHGVKDTPPAAPTVQVTIGRIEVRATPQAENRTHTTRPAAPRLSLDDYLRSRGGANK